MLDNKDVSEMRNELKEYDDQRELIIKKSRDVLKLSKQLIYAIHRDEMDVAAKLVQEIKKERAALDKIANGDPFLVTEGSYKVALQEYAEAVLYFFVVKEHKLATRKELGVHTDYYILGLCDLTGELVRKAVYLAGKGLVPEVIRIKDLVDEIYGELLSFDLRDNEARRKMDAVKYDLRKLEDLALDLKLKGRV